MEIHSSSSGKTIELSKGQYAFLPAQLPPHIEWNTHLVSVLSRADFLIGKLARESSRLPNPDLLMQPFITREAVLSSKIEGTRTTISEALVYEINHSKHISDDLQEVHNYTLALNFALKRLESLPLSLRLIKETHRKLMQGVRGEKATPGLFRDNQNWIGPPGCTLNTATYVPPPVNELATCLKDLEAFLHDRTLPPLIHVALCHYQFEAIHPFLDGNGRIGRLLITLLMMEQNVLPAPILYLSAFFEATRHDYYHLLLNVSTKGAWQDWLIYFLNGIALQSEDALSRAERINDLLDKWQHQFKDSANQTVQDIIKQLATNPYITTNNAANALSIAYTTADRAIKRLLAQGIIEQIGDQERDKIYCAKSILTILEEPAKIKPD